MSNRTAAEVEHELAMLAYVRDRLRASEGKDFNVPTTAVDLVLDELNRLELLEPPIDIRCHEMLVPCRRCKTLVNR
ncbi:hypothetical protein [Rhodococcus opacus]|uniref:Uncharacterized protein n=1 Tax=Rhodococcus opacus TaxID=37919 RepID=A0A2S8INH4_RHOOP|nr:hypothetical protein [Rhodococcus opacus]PQP15942.1 hypothetical protein C5613_37465 [Rhodococcus opacus]